MDSTLTSTFLSGSQEESQPASLGSQLPMQGIWAGAKAQLTPVELGGALLRGLNLMSLSVLRTPGLFLPLDLCSGDFCHLGLFPLIFAWMSLLYS